MRLAALGVVLCYNDADILPDTLDHLLENNHDVIAWDHGSDDGTASVLDKYAGQLIERTFVPRSVDFYDLYGLMSRHLMERYTRAYDFISWPDQDEILEGPTRDRSYYDWLGEVADSPHGWIRFENHVFWFTSEDDPGEPSPVRRVRRYALWPDCPPRIRAWRASLTNIRWFNHNELDGTPYPQSFKLRHYPMRSPEQMRRRLEHDRADLARDGHNVHYQIMQGHMDRLTIAPEHLHYDDGRKELSTDVVFDWLKVYRPDGWVA